MDKVIQKVTKASYWDKYGVFGDREVAQLVKTHSVNIRPELEFSEPMYVSIP